jgi:uncharacterized protein
MASRYSTTDVHTALHASVATALTRRVAASNTTEFERRLHTLLRVAGSAPGQLQAEVLRGNRAGGLQDYHIIYRFENTETLREWEDSPVRLALAAQVDALATAAGGQRLTGLEAWFDLPPSTTARPPRARMALLTWLGIWPLVTIALKSLAPRLNSLPLVLRTAVITGLLMLTMTYLVMPILVRLAAPLLRPQRKV